MAGLVFAGAAGTARAQAEPPTPRAEELQARTRWFPIHARFAPSGEWAMVNLCHYDSPTLCRLVRWHVAGEPHPIAPGVQSTGRWSLVAGAAKTLRPVFRPDPETMHPLPFPP